MLEDSPVLEAMLYGVVLSMLNTIAGVVIAKRSATLPLNSAMTRVLVGMVVRLAVLAVLTWICLTVLNLLQVAFALSLMISFFLFVMVEGFFFHTQHERNKQPFIKRKRTRFPDYDERYQNNDE